MKKQKKAGQFKQIERVFARAVTGVTMPLADELFVKAYANALLRIRRPGSGMAGDAA